MNEEILTALRELALRSKKSSWWQPWQMAGQTGNDDAELIAALSPEIVLELLYEIERGYGIQSALLECGGRVHQLIAETNKYAAEISRGKSATIKMGIQLDEAKESVNALTLALEVERDAANMYAKQVAHWIGKHDDLLAQQLATPQQAQPAPVPVVPCHIVNIGHRFDGKRQVHIPQLLLEFEPVPIGSPNDAKGWSDRDAMVSLIATSPAAPAVQPLTDEQINAIWNAKDLPEHRSHLSPWGMDRIRAIVAASRGIAAPREKP